MSLHGNGGRFLDYEYLGLFVPQTIRTLYRLFIPMTVPVRYERSRL